MKTKFSILASIALCFMLASNAFAATALKDIDQSYAKNEITKLHAMGIIDGYEDHTFRPKQEITREEFAKLICVAFGLEEDAQASAKFTDVSPWARGYVGALVSMNITKGKTKTLFGAKDKLTREQMATFFVRAMGMEEFAEGLLLTGMIELNFADEADIDEYAKANVAFAQHIGLIKGIGNNRFAPDSNAERQAVARLIYEVVVNFDTKYMPQLLKFDMPDLVDVTVNQDGRFTLTFKESELFVKNQVIFDKEEIDNGSIFLYSLYRMMLYDYIDGEKWNEYGSDLNEGFAFFVILAWQLNHSGVTVHPDYYINIDMEDMNAEVNEAGVKVLVNGINAFYADAKNRKTILDERTLISLGYKTGVLVGK